MLFAVGKKNIMLSKKKNPFDFFLLEYVKLLQPGSVLGAAVDVGPVLHQVAHDAQPAAGAGLVQGTVAGVILVVDVADAALKAIQHHLLDGERISRPKKKKRKNEKKINPKALFLLVTFKN